MSESTFEQRMLAQAEKRLEEATSMTSMAADGEQAAFEKLAELRADWAYWKKKVNLQTGKKRRITPIKMGGV